MERYAPTLKDLAPRDFVSRCMDQEIKEGRGCGPNKDYVVLDMTHLGAETIMKRLPSVYEIGHNFANVDITREPIPVVPTIHYQMGGVPTNVHGQVVVPKGRQPEHGGQRLVCGGRMLVRERARREPAGHQFAARSAGVRSCGGRPHRRLDSERPRTHKPLPADAADRSLARLARLQDSTSGEYAQDVANDIRKSMQQHAGVFRTQASMDEGVKQIKALAERAKSIHLADKSKVFNTALVEALEVENLIEVGAGDDDLRRGTQGMPRRAHGVRLRATGRRPAIPERPQRRASG